MIPLIDPSCDLSEHNIVRITNVPAQRCNMYIVSCIGKKRSRTLVPYLSSLGSLPVLVVVTFDFPPALKPSGKRTYTSID